jgi:hypothetical protein
MIVSLTWDDIETAAWVGMRRSLARLQLSIIDKYGANGPGNGGFDTDVLGAIVEQAVAQYFNLHWRSRIGFVRAVDVGGCIEVKSARRDNDRLLLHHDNPDDLPFVLGIVKSLPHVDLRGWILARDGKVDAHWDDPVGGRPAFFVPQSALRPMPELSLHLRGVLGRYQQREEDAI